MEDLVFMLLRFLHFLFGITWIGLLYYFNFVQTPFFGETDPAVRSGAIQKLVRRAVVVSMGRDGHGDFRTALAADVVGDAPAIRDDLLDRRDLHRRPDGPRHVGQRLVRHNNLRIGRITSPSGEVAPGAGEGASIEQNAVAFTQAIILLIGSYFCCAASARNAVRSSIRFANCGSARIACVVRLGW